MKNIPLISVLLLCYLVAVFGLGERHGRIVGGGLVEIKDAPFIVALEYASRHICGGAVLSKEWAVTAAHCFGQKVFRRDLALVRAGSAARGQGGTEHHVRRVLKHPGFDYQLVDNDVAMMQLQPLLKFSALVQPINLPKPSHLFKIPQAGDMMTVYGWGLTKETGEPSQFLRSATLPMFPQDECTGLYRSRVNVTEQMLCAGYREGGKDACVLDSGGPLVLGGVLHGLVSWGWGCARPLRPGVYTRLAAPPVGEWILNTVHMNTTILDNIIPV